jgi:hypothetical protein
MTLEDGGTAFPKSDACDAYPGMSLRDYIAIAIAAGMSANSESQSTMYERCLCAYQCADFMLRVRDLTKEQIKAELHEEQHKLRI